ncbi:GtrA family protein [Rhizobium sp. IBUN]|uniref:GtrA family protein n=1 Tax=Rhizobium sp. IBUN TaxID=1042326 RepID=UPI00047096BA|nr:GtrA family protein [Rhizobium sp. IBUN]
MSAANRRWFIQLLRYGILGVSTNVLGFVLYLVVTHLGVGSKMAMTVLYCLGTFTGLVVNRNWVFGSDAKMVGTTIRYLAAYVVGYFINFSILALFVDRLGFSHTYVQAVSIMTVAIFLFISFKLFVFPRTLLTKGNIG